MAFLAKKANLIDPGYYHGICYGVIDLGTQLNEKYKNWSARLMLLFELPEVMKDFDGERKPMAVSCSIPNLLTPRARLGKLLTGWFKRQFTPEEFNNFDLFRLLGQHANLQIVHTETGGSVKVENILPPTHINAKRYNEFQKFTFCEQEPIPGNIPSWIIERIMESKEWKALHGDQPEQQGIANNDVPPLDPLPQAAPQPQQGGTVPPPITKVPVNPFQPQEVHQPQEAQQPQGNETANVENVMLDENGNPLPF